MGGYGYMGEYAVERLWREHNATVATRLADSLRRDVRYLPPDRPTLLSHNRMRYKIDTPSRPPFVARCAKADFFHSGAWLE